MDLLGRHAIFSQIFVLEVNKSFEECNFGDT